MKTPKRWEATASCFNTSCETGSGGKGTGSGEKCTGKTFSKAGMACGFTKVLNIFHPEMLREQDMLSLTSSQLKTPSHLPVSQELWGQRRKKDGLEWRQNKGVQGTSRSFRDGYFTTVLPHLPAKFPSCHCQKPTACLLHFSQIQHTATQVIPFIR